MKNLKNLKLVKTSDGSYTFFSSKYDECYHSVKGGAILESFLKFSLPLYRDLKKQNKNEIILLDIGFGLGYNILSLLYLQKNYFPNLKVKILSIEKDKNLLELLDWSLLPKPLNKFSYILDVLKSTKSKTLYLGFESAFYISDNIEIIILFEDLRKVFLRLKKANIEFDYVFHDAFSFLKNPEAWSYEVFLYEKNLLREKGKIFTYACAKPIKRAFLELNFSLKLNDIKDNFLKSHLENIIKQISFDFYVPEKYKENPIKAIFEIFERHPGLEATKNSFSKNDKYLLENLKKDIKSIPYRDSIFLNKEPKIIKLDRDNKLKGQ